MAIEHLLAKRTKNLKVNAIREILKVVSKPGMISLAGGIPSPECFPLETIGKLAEVVIDKYSVQAFQYDRTEGFAPLREALVNLLQKKGLRMTADEMYVGSGSQGVLDAIGKILITKGDRIAVEAPTYLGAISAFNPYEPEFLRMDTDDDGLIPESLEEILKQVKVKFIYIVPTFQNPTGRTVPMSRRKEIAEIIMRHDALLIEDDPYGDLRYRGDTLIPIKTLAPDHVIYVGTLSKVFAPGLRIGFYVAPKPINKWLVLVKQGVDLHTSTFNQALAAEYISGGYLEKQLPKIIENYRPKQEAMFSALNRYFPDHYTWSKPEGGMFVWVKGPKGLDMETMYWKAVSKNVAFVPGKFFFTQRGEGSETMRLNYTVATEEKIDYAVKTLAQVLRNGDP